MSALWRAGAKDLEDNSLEHASGKMPLKKLSMTLVTGLLLVAVSVGVVSCGRGISGTLVDLIREVPEGATSLVYWDTDAMLDDSDLHSLVDKWKEDNEAWLGAFGIGSGRVDHFLHFSMYGNDALVVRGDFELDQVRANLESQNYTEGDWKYVEVWESSDEQDGLAVTKGSLIGGRLDIARESINVIKGDSSSLYDDQDIREVTDRLPSGIMLYLHKYTEAPLYKGLVADGASFEKKDEDTLKIRLVYKFGRPEDVAGALEAIRDDVDEDYSKVDAKQDGKFAILAAEVETEYLV